MKTIYFRSVFAAALMAVLPSARSATIAAQVNVDNDAPPVVQPAPSVKTGVRLPYGVADVLKLTKAQVSEEVIVNYIDTSGTIYNLAPNDIVYLRDQGVSDHVINAMLDQRKRAVRAMQSQPQSAPQQPSYNQYPNPVDQPVQPAPSSVYVIPSDSSYAYPAYYPYYSYSSPYYYGGYPYTYGGYCYSPGFSFRFGLPGFTFGRFGSGFGGGFHHFGGGFSGGGGFHHFGGGFSGGGGFHHSGGGFSGGGSGFHHSGGGGFAHAGGGGHAGHR